MSLILEAPPQEAPVSSPSESSKERVVLAGFWWRSCAHMIDTVLFTMITLPLLIGFYWQDILALARETMNNPALGSSASMGLFHGPAGILIQYVIPSIVVIVMWRWRSATPGKILLNLKIVDAKTMDRPTMVQFFSRFFGYLASLVPLGLGCFWVAWDSRKQGWHDKLAGTTVVRVLR